MLGMPTKYLNYELEHPTNKSTEYACRWKSVDLESNRKHSEYLITTGEGWHKMQDVLKDVFDGDHR